MIPDAIYVNYFIECRFNIRRILIRLRRFKNSSCNGLELAGLAVFENQPAAQIAANHSIFPQMTPYMS